MDNIYDVYKPFRNHLRKLALDDSFYVIWAYIQHLQFKKPFPRDIEILLEFLNKSHAQKVRMCSEWELELITRELILNAQDIQSNKTLKKWDYFLGTINKLKKLEEEIGKIFVNKDNILVELFRIAHRQFPWQISPNGEFLTRYYKIFNQEKLNNIFIKTLRLSVEKFYLLGMLFIGAFLENPAINLPVSVEVNSIDKKDVENFLKFLSLPIGILKNKIKNEVNFNDKFIYSFSSLKKFPIIEMEYRNKNSLVCPLPTLLFWQITEGIYYKLFEKINEIENEEDKGDILGSFGNLLGQSFQKYTGEVLKKAILSNEISYLKEEEYGNRHNKKHTVDWIVLDNNSALFIECKTKKISLPVKIELNDDSFIKKEISIIAESIKQIYKSIDDYKGNKYPNLKYENGRKIFPIILTMGNWHLFRDKFLEELNFIVRKENNSIEQYLIDYPFSICSIEEFEVMMQIINTIGISSFMNGKFEKDRSMWTFQAFMNNDFGEEQKRTRFLFKEEYENIFNRVLLDNKNNPK